MGRNAKERNELAQEAWALLLNVHARLIRAMGETAAAGDALPIEWYDVLLALQHAPGRRLRLSELADRMVFSRSGLTRLVDRIEEQGYLRRERCSDDRRGAFAVLTNAGAAAMHKAWPIYRDQIQSRFSDHLTAEQAEAMRDGLARVLTANGGGVLAAESPPVQVPVRGRRSVTRG